MRLVAPLWFPAFQLIWKPVCFTGQQMALSWQEGDLQDSSNLEEIVFKTPSAAFLPTSWLYLARFNSSLQEDWIMAMEGTQFASGKLSVLASDAIGNLYAGGIIQDSLNINGQILLGTQESLSCQSGQYRADKLDQNCSRG